MKLRGWGVFWVKSDLPYVNYMATESRIIEQYEKDATSVAKASREEFYAAPLYTPEPGEMVPIAPVVGPPVGKAVSRRNQGKR